MCDRGDGTSTAQYDELGYCFIKFPNNVQIFNWRENAICQETINGNLTVKHLCEKTCNYCPGDENAEPDDQEQGPEEDQGVDQGQEGEEQDEQEQGGQEQEEEEQEQEQQEQEEDDENQEEQEDNEVERK